MKKLVPESIEESIKFKEREQLNELDFSDVRQKVGAAFKKVGQLFVAFYKNKVLPVLMPINIGILKLTGKLPRGVNYIPNEEDIQMEPSLAKLKTLAPIKARAQADYQELVAKNKGKNFLGESFSGKVNETLIPLKYWTDRPETDKVEDVDKEFIVRLIWESMQDPANTDRLVPCIWGAPGIGKTAITIAMSQLMGEGYRILDVPTSKMKADDWSLPVVVHTELGQQAADMPKTWLPCYEPTGDPEKDAELNDKANLGNGGIIFFDEVSRANEGVQNTLLKILNQRIIGAKHILGDKWTLICATNRMLDEIGDSQFEMGTALKNRCQHYNFVPRADDWITWAKGNKIDQDIINFVDFNRDHFFYYENEATVNTSPRSWVGLSVALQSSRDAKVPMFVPADMKGMFGGVTSRSAIHSKIRGNVHSKTAELFIAWLSLTQEFRPEQIKMIYTDPKKAPKPTKKGGDMIAKTNALMGVACMLLKDRELTAKELENYVQYFIDIQDFSLAAKALWLIVETHQDIHQQVGDIKDGKHNKYKKAMDMFREAWGKSFNDIFDQKREDVMGK